MIKSDFKNTELGILPKDWKILEIKDFSYPVRGGSPRPAGDPRFFNGNYIPWLTVAAITKLQDSKMFVEETENQLTEEGSKFSRILSPGTIVIANSGATLGVAKILNIRCCANDGIAALLNIKENVCSKFLVNYLNFKTKYLREIVATGNGQPNLNTSLIGSLKIPVPPTQLEQKNITRVISDFDELIFLIEKMIIKKQNLKKATMQKILTGNYRLPNFNGTWEIKKLGDHIIKFKKTKRLSSDGKNKGRYNFFTNSTKPCDKYLDFYDFDMEAIIANTGGEAHFNYYHGKFAVMSDCFVFKTNLVTQFLYYLLKYYENYIDDICFAGSGIKHLDKKYFGNIEIYVPSDLKEQKVIAKIFSDMDRELTALESSRNKIVNLKLAIIQELYAGKTRLIYDEMLDD